MNDIIIQVNIFLETIKIFFWNYLAQKNRQYNYRHTSDLTAAPIDEIITNADGHLPIVQTLVREILLERQKRQLIEERLNMREHDYALLHAQHEQTINNMTLLKREYDQCRLDLQNNYIELNEVRHNNQQLRVHIDHLLNDERQQMYSNDAMLYEKRQRRH